MHGRMPFVKKTRWAAVKNIHCDQEQKLPMNVVMTHDLQLSLSPDSSRKTYPFLRCSTKSNISRSKGSVEDLRPLVYFLNKHAKNISNLTRSWHVRSKQIHTVTRNAMNLSRLRGSSRNEEVIEKPQHAKQSQSQLKKLQPRRMQQQLNIPFSLGCIVIVCDRQAPDGIPMMSSLSLLPASKYTAGILSEGGQSMSSPLGLNR